MKDTDGRIVKDSLANHRHFFCALSLAHHMLIGPTNLSVIVAVANAAMRHVVVDKREARAAAGQTASQETK